MNSFKQFIPPFAALLNKVEVANITKDAYAANYLQHLLDNKIYYLNIYAHLLDKATIHFKKPYQASRLMDYGCGNGFLALFAKYAGFKAVVACDLSEPFLSSAEALGKELNISIDKWILGNEYIVQSQLNNQSIDVWIGTDVIEHVYNIAQLLKTIKAINSQMITVFTTASVNENSFKRKVLRKLIMRDELFDSDASQSGNEPFAGVPFLEVRKIIIKETFPHLDKIAINQLALQTRGLNKEDIINLIQSEYLYSKTLTYSPPDKYNTCNPISGSYSERLLPITAYKKLFNDAGMQLSLHLGFYNEFGSTLKSNLLKIANITMRLLGAKGIIITPYTLLIGKMETE